MAGLTPLTLRYPPGPLHTRDPRLKLASLLVLSLVILFASRPALAVPVLLLLGGFWYAEQPLGRTVRALKPLIVVALLIAVSRTIAAAAEISASGISAAAAEVDVTPTAPLSRRPWLLTVPMIPLEAIVFGVDYGSRLLLAALFGQLFLATTSRGRIIDTLRWICTPLPQSLRAHIPLAVAVALSSYPLIARSMQQTRDACIARGVNPKKSPALLVRRIARGAVDETPLRITRAADAVTARGFSPDSTPPCFSLAAADAVLALVIAVSVTAAMLMTAVLPLL